MFDLDVIVPLCGKFRQRIEDFKRYGLVNQGGRKVRINAIISGESIEGLSDGWRGDFVVRVFKNESSEYVANLYRHYLSIDPGQPDFRWLIRVDDDSCTDIDGLVSNLDKFYGDDETVYLGDLHSLQNALNGYEGGLFPMYKHMLGEMEPFAHMFMTEIECGVVNARAASRILGHEPARSLLEYRSTLEGGYGDCVVALAANLAGVRPIGCPFITHLPLVGEFSLLGGFRNHIHMISRGEESENFWERSSSETFALLTKALDGSITEAEKQLVGRRLLIEGENSIRIFEFKDSFQAKLKLDSRRLNWCEFEGSIIVLDGDSVVERIEVKDDGSFHRDGHELAFL